MCVFELFVLRCDVNTGSQTLVYSIWHPEKDGGNIDWKVMTRKVSQRRTEGWEGERRLRGSFFLIEPLNLLACPQWGVQTITPVSATGDKYNLSLPGQTWKTSEGEHNCARCRSMRLRLIEYISHAGTHWFPLMSGPGAYQCQTPRKHSAGLNKQRWLCYCVSFFICLCGGEHWQQNHPCVPGTSLNLMLHAHKLAFTAVQ